MTPDELLEKAAEKLAAAESLFDVKAAHALVRRAVRAKRKDTTASVMFQTAGIAFATWDNQKAQGMSLQDRSDYFEKTLRAAFHWQREEPWHFHCDTCTDTGWMFGVCRKPVTCGRPFKLPGAHDDNWTGRGKCTDGHRFARPCPDCTKGRDYSEAMRKTSRPAADDLASVGKTSKGLTRLGR